MISAHDVGGVHVKYLYHCPRQLWLFARGLRPERISSLVELGEAVHDTTYTRQSPVDLGAARIGLHRRADLGARGEVLIPIHRGRPRPGHPLLPPAR